MALMHLDFESQYTGHNEDVYIILPDKKRSETPAEFYSNGKKYPVLWLLHGTYGGYSDWLRKSNIETYACEHDCIVVMMGVGNSDYMSWPGFTLGYDAESYIIDELMPMVYNWFPASSERKDNFIAGLSMGGMGTIYLALNHPEKFAKAVSLSYPPFNWEAEKKELEELYAKTRKEIMADPELKKQLRSYNRMHLFDSVDEFLASPVNSWKQFEELVKEGADIPKFMFTIGTEDFLFPRYVPWKKHAEEIGLDCVFSEGPGRHEWRVWERDIQKAFKFFGFNDDEEQGNIF